MVMYMFIVLSSFCISIVQSCSCLWSHPQEEYCTADFAIKAKVLSHRETNPIDINRGYLVFTVNVSVDYKGLGWKGKTKEIYTGPNEALCGLTSLAKNKEYILTGKIKDDKPMIDVCGLNVLYSQVSSAIIKGFRKTYRDNCGCKICRFDDECGPGDCYLPAFGSYPCYNLQAVCQRACEGHGGEPMCTWNLDKGWWDCMKKSRYCQLVGSCQLKDTPPSGRRGFNT
ncbi:unnamed protein product [Owenia fusiformis]|uniref:Uncharacterized protein n=1 Tax=Owenia fusiformis TaxID=6347 RepID=A0A8J1Y3T6_OWEFU|nr:unnamed protein product [Owenia fusiformis]